MTVPAERFHVAEYVREEMDARGWTRDRLATEMIREEWGIARLCLDFLLELGAAEPNMRLGREVAEQLGRAFGVSADLFLNLEQAWLDAAPATGEESVRRR